jgi:hypothetical protein
MSESILGQLVDEKAERDAIHIAIAPVVAGERLYPGDHVGFVSEGIVAKRDDKLIGIVDPFLMKPVAEGQRFFLCLYPKTVTGMRHHWQHPAFGIPSAGIPQSELDASKMEAELLIRKWLERYSDVDLGVYGTGNTFERLVADYLAGDYFVFHSFDTPDESETAPIMVALAIYTGKQKPDFRFSCTC